MLSAVQPLPRYSMRQDLPGASSCVEHDALIEVGVDVAERLVHELGVDRPAQREHRRDREHREQQPLPRYGQLEADEPEQADDDRGQAGKHEVELRVDGEQFDAEQHHAQDAPTPPRHVLPPLGNDRADDRHGWRECRK